MPPKNYGTDTTSITVGNAPVIHIGEGVVETVKTELDKFGRTVCIYEIDPALGPDVVDVSKCVADAFPGLSGFDLLLALKTAINPAVASKAWLEQGTAAIADPNCADEAAALVQAILNNPAHTHFHNHNGATAT